MSKTRVTPSGSALRFLRLLIPALFVLAALCQLPSQSSYADDQPPAGASDDAGLAAALKRLLNLGDQNAESDASAMSAYSMLGVASEERPQEKIARFFARQAIPLDEDVMRSLSAALLRLDVEDCRRGGKPNDDCLKQAVSRMKAVGKADLLDRLVASVEQSPIETLRGTKPLAMAASPKWPEVKPQRGPTGGTGGGESPKKEELAPLTLKGHKGSVYRMAASLDGRLMASTGDDNTVRIWNTQDGALVRTLEGFGESLGWVSLSADGKTGASTTASGIRVWDVETGAVKLTLSREAIRSVAISPDGSTLATETFQNSRNLGVSLWDAQTGALKQTVSHPSLLYPYDIRDMVFSPDGRLLVIGTGLQSQSGEVALLDVQQGAVIARLTGLANIASNVAISSDNNTVAGQSLDGALILWDAHTGQIRRTLEGHSVGAFSPDGRVFVSGSANGLEILDAQTGELKKTIPRIGGGRGYGSLLIFLPDGKTILSAYVVGYNPDIYLYRVPVN